MTVYEILCCFKSPNWPNYRNALNPEFDYCTEKIDRNLPLECVDSYLGRLVSIAKSMNEYLIKIQAGDLDKYESACSDLVLSTKLCARKFNPKMKEKLKVFLGYGFPAEWLRPLLQVYMVELWTADGYKTSLNSPEFLVSLQALSHNDFAPVVSWFKKHPEGANSKSQYQEC